MNSLAQSLPAASQDSSLLETLTDEQRERLTSLLDVYLQALEQGVPASPQQMLADHPDLAEPLQVYLDSLHRLHDVAGGFAGASKTNAPPLQLSGADQGQELGDFVLGREIGRGGMGVVYEARQISLDRRVALKVLPFASVLDARQIARFKNEAQAAAQLHHPHIVSVFAIGADRGIHYYAMQFIEGLSLDVTLVKLRALQNSPETPADSYLLRKAANRHEYFAAIAKLGIQAAEALHAAHDQGIVHRDIKPSNLLIDADGDVWVTDFGLARCHNQATLTRTGDIVGTVRYMSPEQARGKSSLVDHRTDIYSLGATLYELATLHPAFAEENQAALLRRIELHEPRRPAQVRRSVPAALDNVISMAMAKQVGDRYETAQQLANDLRCFLEGKPTLAQPLRWTDRAAKWLHHRQRVLWLTLALLLVAVVGTSTAAALIMREKVRAEQNYASSQRHLHQALETVDLFGNQFAARLLDVPEASALQREVLEQTLAYYEKFNAEAAYDPALQAESAGASFKSGVLREQLGRVADAARDYEAALAKWDKLLTRQPTNANIVRQHAQAEQHLASAYRKLGRTEDARKHYQLAVRALHGLVQQSPDDAAANELLSTACLESGQMEAESGTPAAEPLLQLAIKLREAARQQRPDDFARMRGVAQAQAALASYLARRDMRQAAELYHTASKTMEQLIAADPKQVTWRAELAALDASLAGIQRQEKQLEAAAKTLERAITLQKELVLAFPARLSYRRELAISENQHGLLQSELRHWGAAQQAFEQAIERQLPLVQAYPDDLELRSGLGSFYNNLGIAQENLQQITQAEESFRSAAGEQRMAYDAAPANARYVQLLSKHYFNQARMLRELKRHGEALDVTLARRQLWAKDPERLLGVAKELALLSRHMSDPQRCRELGQEVLRDATAAGLELPEGFSWEQFLREASEESL